MILQALYEYYQRKAADPGSTIAPHGLEWKEIPYLILIDKKGNFLELQDTTEGVGKQKRAKKYLVVKSKGRTYNPQNHPSTFSKRSVSILRFFSKTKRLF